MHRIMRGDKEASIQVSLYENGEVGQWIFPRKLPGEQESQRKAPSEDDPPTNQKTFWVYRMYCGFSLHAVEIRRLKYAPEPAPSTTMGWRLLRRCQHCYPEQTSLIQFGRRWTQNGC